MAKYRHRIFEMYDYCDEAILALTPKSEKIATEATAPESWTFKYLVASRSASVTHVQFKKAPTFGEEDVSDIRDDFVQLADKLDRDNKVVLDFTGLKSIDSVAIDVLLQFKRKLQNKGSRFALCCLDPTAREAFFPPAHHKR